MISNMIKEKRHFLLPKTKLDKRNARQVIIIFSNLSIYLDLKKKSGKNRGPRRNG